MPTNKKVKVLEEFSGLIEINDDTYRMVITPEEVPALIDKMKGAAQKIYDLRHAGKLPQPRA